MTEEGMVLDESTLERMLANGKNPREFQRPPARLLDATEEFEVYERAAPEGVVEKVRQDPPAEDAEEYPPRQHRAAPPTHPPAPAPAPAPTPAPASPAPVQAAPPSSPVLPPPSSPVSPPSPAPPVPTPHPSAPRQWPEAPADPHEPETPTRTAPEPVATPPPENATRPPPRPQVFSLQRPTPKTASTAPSSAAGPASPQTPAPYPNGVRTGHGGPPRIALVQADYNADVTDLMAQWATRHAQQMGAEVAYHVHVPGVYDVPLATKILARREDVDAVVVVGAVIQGETGHDELIAREAARLLADVAYQYEKPVGLGIAGPRMTQPQAEARIMMGRNAVESVLRQLETLAHVR